MGNERKKIQKTTGTRLHDSPTWNYKYELLSTLEEQKVVGITMVSRYGINKWQFLQHFTVTPFQGRAYATIYTFIFTISRDMGRPYKHKYEGVALAAAALIMCRAVLLWQSNFSYTGFPSGIMLVIVLLETKSTDVNFYRDLRSKDRIFASKGRYYGIRDQLSCQTK